MTTNTNIALNKLLAWDGNVRKTESNKNIDELAASISAHGLLQSLVVRKDKRGRYAVVAGRRRLLALQSLAENGNIARTMLIPCNILDDATDATEISLAENVQREAMHPADEFDAFRALIDSGIPPADYVRPEDAPRKTRNAQSVTLPDGTVVEGARDIHSAALIESLTAHRSAALSAALLEHPAAALAVTVHVMALQVFYNGHSDDTALQIIARPASFRRVEGSAIAAFLDKAREHWRGRIPGEPAKLFAWCLAQDADTLRGLLAFCVSQTVNSVRLKADRADCERMAHADTLATTLKLDLTAWFTPTARSYFGSISKAAIIDVLGEIKGNVAPEWSGVKKSDLAALAEREVQGTGWLPVILRAPEEREPESGD